MTGEALLRAIDSDRLDPLPRLVYADWCAENGMVVEEKRQREIARLLATSKQAYKIRAVSHGYWARLFAFLLMNRPGHVRVEFHDLRGTPPPGVVWVRRSRGGKWMRPRKEKYGKPLKENET